MAPKHFLAALPLAFALLAARTASAQTPTAASPPPGGVGGAPSLPAPPPPPLLTPGSPADAPAAAPGVTVVLPVAAAPGPPAVAGSNPAPIETAPPVVVPSVQLTVPWTGPTGKGVSFGLEEGAWSGVWGTGLRVFVPFVEHLGGRYAGSLGLTLRGLVLTGANTSTAAAPADHAGGRFELVGRSPVYLNLVRLYGGGGVEVFSAFGSGVDHEVKVGGGGQFGFEFFLNKRFSFYLEVGGHSGVDKGLPGGETVVTGMNLYPF